MNESVPVESLTIPLPSWRSHKVVQALKIAAIIPNPRGFELHFEDRRFCPIAVSDDWVNKHLPEDKASPDALVGGFFVVYPDNYRSWSPAAAFEDGYTPVHGAGIAADAVHELRDLAQRGQLTTGLMQPGEPTLSRAALDVLAERRRQVEEEGFTPEDDDKFRHSSLASAAGCYAMHTLAYPAGDPPSFWPFGISWWKPSPDERRNRVKAAALLLAEIERLDRAAAAGGDA